MHVDMEGYTGNVSVEQNRAESEGSCYLGLKIKNCQLSSLSMKGESGSCHVDGDRATIENMKVSGAYSVVTSVDTKEIVLDETAKKASVRVYSDVEKIEVQGDNNRVVLSASAEVESVVVAGDEAKVYGWGNLKNAVVTGGNAQVAVPGADVEGEHDATIPDEMYDMIQTPSTPSKPSTPSTPDTPDTPDEPDEPDVPSTPEEPDEPDTPCEEHTPVYKAELAEGATDCEEGILVKKYCQKCGEVLEEREDKGHVPNEKERIDLNEYAAGCNGYIIISECACGATDERVTLSIGNWMEWELTPGETENIDILLHKTSGLKVKQSQEVKDPEDCRAEFRDKIEVFVDDVSVLNVEREGITVAHTGAIKTELLDGSVTCEDGVRVNQYCVECGFEIVETTINEHDCFMVDAIYLEEAGLCNGYFEKYSCACGQEQWVNYELDCDFDASAQSSYEDTEGHMHYVTTYTCRNCSFKLVEDYMEVENDDCKVDVRKTFTMYVDDEEVKELSEESYYFQHVWDYVSIELVEGATSCEDGYFYEAVCKECGETESGEGCEHIKTLERMEFDPSEYGVAMLCEGYYEIDYCACGEGTSINNAFECTFTEYDLSYRDEEGNWHEQIGYACQLCALQYVEDTMVVPNPDGTKTKTVGYWFTVGGMPAKELVIEMRVSGDTPLPTPKPVLYDFRDGSIVPTDTDGKFSISYGPLFIGKSDSATYQYNGTQHGVAFKNGNTIEIFVTGPARIEIADCSYSGMKELTLTNKTGTWTQTKASGISCTEEIAFEYIGEETTLILELTDQVYIPYIRVTPFIYDGELPEEPVVTEYDFGDGSIIPTDTNGKSDVNSGDLTVKVGPSNAYSYNDEQHGVYFKDGNSIEIEVDGSVVVEVGDCSYSAATSLTMTNADGTWTQTKDCKQGCYHNGSVVTFEYTGEATTLILAFTDAAYVPHIKVTTVVEE